MAGGRVPEKAAGGGDVPSALRRRVAPAVGHGGESLAAFCTLAGKDDVENTPLTPWIGFVYTYPEYRGERRSGRLIERACALARADGFERVYLSSNEVGLYEKYGFTYLTRMKDAWGEDTGVYCRRLEA